MVISPVGRAVPGASAARRLAGMGALPLLLAIGSQAEAQTAAEMQAQPAADEVAAEATPPAGVSDIVVTARKREENLQNTPIAITAVGAAQLEARGSVDLTSVQSIAPNLTLKTGGGTSGATFTPVINIRGIGQGDFTINTDPGVGVYVDGVYLGRTVGSVLDLADVERVEVLRGPQGTLFGRNTIGGAISLVSKAPSTQEISGTFMLTGGSREFAQVRGTMNLPLTDTLAVRIAAVARHRGGYVDARQYDDFELGGEELWGARAALRFTPTSTLTIDLAVDHTERKDPPSAGIPLQLGDVSLDGSGPTGALSIFFNRGVGPAAVARAPYISSTAPRCATDAAFRNSSRTCYGNAWLEGTSGNNSVWTDRSGAKIKPVNELNATGYMATIAFDSSVGTLKSITSYREFDSTFYSDIDFTPYFIFANNNVPYDQQQFSQELQLVGSALDGRLDYVLGVYYFNETGDQAVDLFAPGNVPAPQAAALAPFLPYFQTTTRTVDNSSTAGYGQLTFAVTDRLKVTGGLRYTDENKDYVVTQTRTVGAVQSAEGVQATKIWTPMANVAWQATDAVLLYGTYSEGYRAGGFAARFNAGLISPLPSYAPEFVTSYEAGVKTSLLDRRLILNLAAFRIDYSDIQVTATTPGLAGFVLNLADARFTGFEAEARAVLGSGFSADASVGYTDKDLVRVAPGTLSSEGTNAVVPITTESILPGPAWQLNGQLQHRATLAGGGQIDSLFNVHYESSESNSVANYPIIVQGPYAEAEARIAYTLPSGRTTLALGARNVFDATYYTTKTLSTTSGSAYGTLARPREIYAQLVHRFGS